MKNKQLILNRRSFTKGVLYASLPLSISFSSKAQKINIADRTAEVQAAIDKAVRAGSNVELEAGIYGISKLVLTSSVNFSVKSKGIKFYQLSHEPIFNISADNVTLSGIEMIGNPQGAGLIHADNSQKLVLSHSNLHSGGGTAITAIRSSGQLYDNAIKGFDVGIYAYDNKNFSIYQNSLRHLSDNGILVWRSVSGADGTRIFDNQIDNIGAKSGGNGPYGNGINVFRADDVKIFNNKISECAFSAIRCNNAQRTSISYNKISDCKEVALYAEFGSYGTNITNNEINNAAYGISVPNQDNPKGMTLIENNIISNIYGYSPVNPDVKEASAISVERNTIVRNNRISNVNGFGIRAGWGEFANELEVYNNKISDVKIGIAKSMVGSGPILIKNNIFQKIHDYRISGYEWHSRVKDEIDK